MKTKPFKPSSSRAWSLVLGVGFNFCENSSVLRAEFNINPVLTKTRFLSFPASLSLSPNLPQMFPVSHLEHLGSDLKGGRASHFLQLPSKRCRDGVIQTNALPRRGVVRSVFWRAAELPRSMVSTLLQLLIGKGGEYNTAMLFKGFG